MYRYVVAQNEMISRSIQMQKIDCRGHVARCMSGQHVPALLSEETAHAQLKSPAEHMTIDDSVLAGPLVSRDKKRRVYGSKVAPFALESEYKTLTTMMMGAMGLNRQ